MAGGGEQSSGAPSTASEEQQNSTSPQAHVAASSSEPQAQEPAAAVADGESEDPNECGWCKWMKAGGCKEQFEVWLKCVDDVRDAGREDVASCATVMGPLWDCMQQNSDYYAMQLDNLKGKTPGSAEDGAGAKDKESGLVGMAVEVVEELEEMVESVLGLDDD